MSEGWLVDSGTNWVWRFRRDDKSSVRAPKVFMDRVTAMPDGQPPPSERMQTRPSERPKDDLAQPLVDGVEKIRTSMWCFSRTLTSKQKKR